MPRVLPSVWKLETNIEQTEKLSSFGIMGFQLRVISELLALSQHYRIDGFKGAFNKEPSKELPSHLESGNQH